MPQVAATLRTAQTMVTKARTSCTRRRCSCCRRVFHVVLGSDTAAFLWRGRRCAQVDTYGVHRRRPRLQAIRQMQRELQRSDAAADARALPGDSPAEARPVLLRRLRELHQDVNEYWLAEGAAE